MPQQRRQSKRSSPSTRLLSVIVPAYCQEKTIAGNLRKIKEALDVLDVKYEIICVVDGMVDKTFSQAGSFARRYDNIQAIGYKENKGKGHAVRYGMARSRGDVIAFIDAGMDLHPGGLAMALNHFDWYNADIIVGSKRHPVSIVDYPWQRKVLSFGYQMLVRVLFGLNVRDTQVGLKFFRREVLEKTLPRLLVKAYAFDIEMLAVAHSLGYKRIYEAPVELKLEFGGGSTIASRGFLKTAFWVFWDTLAVFYRLRILRYYSDKNHRKWRYDPELDFRVNVG